MKLVIRQARKLAIKKTAKLWYNIPMKTVYSVSNMKQVTEKQVSVLSTANALSSSDDVYKKAMAFLNKDGGIWTKRRKILCLSATVPALISLTSILGAALMIPYMYVIVPILVAKHGYKLEEAKEVTGNSNKSSTECGSDVCTGADPASAGKTQGVIQRFSECTKAENTKSTDRSSAESNSFMSGNAGKVGMSPEKERVFTLGDTIYTASQLRSVGIKLHFVFIGSGFCIALIKDSMFSNLTIALPFLGIHLYCFIKNMPLSVILGYFKVLSWGGVGGVAYKQRDDYYNCSPVMDKIRGRSIRMG